MKNCVSCGKSTRDHAEFPCPNCGNATVRCKECRSRTSKYKCSKCEWVGP